MLKKRGISISYWRMFSFAFILLVVLFVLIIPTFFFGKLGFNILFKKDKLFLSPDSNATLGENVSPAENVSNAVSDDNELVIPINPDLSNETVVNSSNSNFTLGEVNATKSENNSEINVTVSENNVTEIINNTFENATENEINNNATASIVEPNRTEVNATVSNLVKVNTTLVSRIVVGMPVKWEKELTLNENGGNVSLPKEAEDIVVKKSSEISLSPSGESRNSFFALLRKIFSVLTGRVSEEIVPADVIIKDSSKEVIINEAADYKIEYTTPAPSVREENVNDYRKRVVVSGPDLGYINILTFTGIPEILPVGKEDLIMVYWVEQKSYEPFNAYDSDRNGLLDYVEWNTPHLSEQTFEIILITKAEHLDSSRNFIGDVYLDVKERDNVWTEQIPAGDYLRVRFERNLTSEKDITLYARSSNGGNVEVYEKEGVEKIADFGGISEDKDYKIYLTNLIGEQDSFDLLVSGGDVEFDYIVDPSVVSNASFISNNITTEPYPLSHITLNDSSLVFYMPFDVNDSFNGVQYDYSGNNNDGQMTITPGTTEPIWTTTSFGSGYNFTKDGTSASYLNASDSSSLDLNNDLTLIMWINPETVSISTQQLLAKSRQQGAASPRAYAMYLALDEVQISYYDGAFFRTFTTTTANLVPGNWYNIAYTRNAGQEAIYVNGAGISSQAPPFQMVNNNYALYLGGRASSTTEEYDGLMDEVMIFNRSLTSAEISNIYNNQFYRYKTPAVQLFQNISISQDGTLNKVNVTTNSTLLQGTNLNLRLRGFNSSGANIVNSSWQNVVTGDNKVLIFNVLTTTYNITLEFNYSASANNFYSPVLKDSIDVVGWEGESENIIPLTDCGDLTTQNAIYVLQNDIVNHVGTCFRIQANNIALNGNGFSIDGDNGADGLRDYGIYAADKVNITIKNFLVIKEFGDVLYNLEGDGAGIYFQDVNNSIISNLSSNYNWNGIYLFSSFYNNLTDINAGFNSDSGVFLTAGSNNNNLNNIIARTNVMGVYLSLSINNLLNNITADSNEDSGIFLSTDSNSNQLKNILADLNLFGVFMFSDNNSIANFKLNLNLHGLFLSSSSNNTFIKGDINGSRRDAIYILFDDAVSLDNVFTNVTVRNTNSSFNDFFFEVTNGTKFIDMPYIGNYSFFGAGGTILVRKTDIGEIKFLKPVNGSGTNFSAEIQILNNNITVLGNKNSGLNKSANVTLFGLPTTFTNPQILKDGIVCGNKCYNFTSLNAGTVIFNVTSWTSYSIGEAGGADSCRTLSTPNEIVSLNNNVSSVGTCFVITANNVTLNCLGNIINYSTDGGNGEYGIDSVDAVDLTIKNCRIVEDDVGGSNNGIYFHGGNNNNLINISIETNSDSSDGLYLISDYNNLSNINIRTQGNNARGASISGDFNNLDNVNINTLNFGGLGIYLISSSYNKINNLTTETPFSTGINLLGNSPGSLNNEFKNVKILKANRGVQVNNLDAGFIMEDSIINASSGNDIYVNGLMKRGEWNLTNVSRQDGSAVEVNWLVGGNGTLNVHWYVDAQVNNATGPVVNSNVKAFDKDNVQRFLATTGADGRIPRKSVLEYRQTNITSGSLRTYYSNYTFNASNPFGGLDLTQSWNMSVSRNLAFMFSEGGGGACGALSTPNAVVTLTNNVASTGTCFTISANNISLDCNGYTINYSQDSGNNQFGIYSVANFTTIQNCSIFQGGDSVGGKGINDSAIYFRSVHNAKIINASIFTIGNQSVGILMSFSNNNTLLRNFIKASNNFSAGIYFGDSWNNSIYDSNISSHYGITFFNSSRNLFLRDNINSPTNYGLGVAFGGFSDNNTFYDSFVGGTGNDDIVFGGLTSGILNLINTTLKSNRTRFTGPTNPTASVLKVYWYGDIYTNNSDGGVVEGANILAYNVTGSLILSDYTNSNGLLRMILLEYKQNLSYLSNQNNYTIIGRFDGVDLSQSWNISTNRNLVFSFETSAPLINFTYPTPANGSRVSNSAEINVSIIENELGEVKLNWNDVNYSMYDNSLILMMNLDNISKLGENDTFMRDLTMYRNNGRCSGTHCPKFNVSSGKYGGAFKFDGIDDSINLSNMDIYGNALTISAWIKADSFSYLSDQAGRIVSKAKGVQTSDHWWMLSTVDSSVYCDPVGTGIRLRFRLKTSDGITGLLCASSEDLLTSMWIYAVAVYNGSDMILYKDGVEVGKMAKTGNIAVDNTIEAWIGANPHDFYDSWNGTIDEVRIWNRSLSIDEIKEQYSSNLFRYNQTQWYFYINKTGLSPGNNNYFACAKDIYGNENCTETRSVNVTSAPLINLIYPPNGKKLLATNSTYINYSIQDIEGDSMEVWVYGTSSSLDRLADFLLVHQKNLHDGNFSYNWKGMPVDPLSDGLKALYHLDNNIAFEEGSGQVYDFSGNGNNGTVYGNSIFNETGYFAGAYKFDGNPASYINVSDSSSLDLGSSFTLSAWVNPATVSIANQAILIKGGVGTANPRAYAIYLSNDEVQINWYNAGWRSVSTTNANLIPGNWYHIAITSNSSTRTIYVNGLYNISGVNMANPPVNDNNALKIGSRGNSGGTENFNGVVDEVAIWNRTLSAYEIMNLAMLTPGRYYWQVNVSDGYGDSYARAFFKLVTPPFTDNIFINSTFGTNTTNENFTCYAEANDDPDANEYLSAYWKWYNGSSLFSQGIKDMRTETEKDNSLMVLLHFNNDSSFKENDTFIYDHSGNGNNATAVCGTGGIPCPRLVEGYFGSAFNFTYIGANSNDCNLQNDNTHLVINDSDDLSIGPNFTISAWIYYVNNTGYSLDDHEILSHSGQSEQVRYTFGVTDDTVAGSGQSSGSYPVGRLRFDLKDPSSRDHYSESVIIPYQWHFVSLVRAGDKIIFYIDGFKDSERPLNAAGDPKTFVINPPRDIWIGESGEPVDCNEGWNGEIEELGIWNKSLSSEEIKYLYERGKGVGVLRDISLLNGTNTAAGNIWNCTVFMSNRNDNETEDNNVSVEILSDQSLRIKDIELGNLNIDSGKMKNVKFSVIVESSDLLSVNLLNASFDFGGITRGNASCAYLSNIDAITANYSCTIGLWYFDPPGLWNVTAYVKDSLGQFDYYNETFALFSDVFCDNNGTVSWTELSPGDANKFSDNSFFIRNTGNTAFPPGGVKINSSDLYGEGSYSSYTIPASNFYVNILLTGTCSGNQMMHRDNVDVTNVVLDVGNNSAGAGIQELFFCINNIPTALPPVSYKAAGQNSWEILCADF